MSRDFGADMLVSLPEKLISTIHMALSIICFINVEEKKNTKIFSTTSKIHT